MHAIESYNQEIYKKTKGIAKMVFMLVVNGLRFNITYACMYDSQVMNGGVALELQITDGPLEGTTVRQHIQET